LGGQERISDRGSYCVPCGDQFGKAANANDWKNAILDYAINTQIPAKGRTAQGRMSVLKGVDKKGGGRYKSVNIMPWIAGRAFKRPDTTVEFRLHRGTHDAKQIVAWTQLLQDIVQWCIMSTERDFEALPSSAARCLAVMSERSKPWLVLKIGEWRKATVNGPRHGTYNAKGKYREDRKVKVRKGWAIKPEYKESA
jgi:hypothetical protein